MKKLIVVRGHDPDQPIMLLDLLCRRRSIMNKKEREIYVDNTSCRACFRDKTAMMGQKP